MNTLSKKSAAFIFMAPAVLIYTVIVILPILISAGFSLTNWNGLGKMEFIGLKIFRIYFMTVF